MEDQFRLPDEIALDASIRGNEYGWRIEQFPSAIENAKRLGFACLGGQFQFRFPDGIFEMYWLYADSESRTFTESAVSYVQSSCDEVLASFKKRVADSDFISEGGDYVQEQLRIGLNPMDHLVFVAYFERQNLD